MKEYFHKYNVYLLILIWILVQIAILINVGIETGFEGDKYALDSQKLLNNFEINFERLFYFTYTLLISISRLLQLDFGGVIFIQLVFSAISSVLFYKLLNKIQSNKTITFIGTLLLISSFQIELWNFRIFTESLFTSLLIILIYYIFISDFSKNLHLVKIFILLLLLSFLRPIGIFVDFSFLILLVLRIKQNLKQSSFIYIILIFIILLIIFSFKYYYHDIISIFDELQSKKYIIAGYDSQKVFSKGVKDLNIFYIIILRILYFFSGYRPYYAVYHNIIEILFTPVIIFAFIGIKELMRKNLNLFSFIIIIIFEISLFAIFTAVNWHGRFISPILPLFIIMATFGINKIQNQFCPFVKDEN